MSISFVEQLKKYQVVLLVLIVLCGLSCSPTKKMLASSVKSTTATEQTTTKEQDQHITAKSVEQTDTTTDDEVVTVVKTYDTSQPVNEITGMPPLQSEVTQTRRSVQQQEHRQATEEVAGSHTIEQERITQNETIVEQTEATQERGLNVLHRTLIYIGAISIILFLSWIGVKLLKKHLKPF